MARSRPASRKQAKARTAKSPATTTPRTRPKAAPRPAKRAPVARRMRPAKRAPAPRRARQPAAETSGRSRPRKPAPLEAALAVPAPSRAVSKEARAAAADLTPAVPSPPGRPAPSASPFSIPTGYGDHLIVLMVKDPWWLYAYWELKPDVERQARRQLSPEEVPGLRTALRVHDVTGRAYPGEEANRCFEVTISDLAMNWFLHVNAPNRSFIVEIGLLTLGGRFLMLARSNRVTTPRFGPSEVLDEEWMVSDEAYWKLFGVTAGVGMGSSAGLKEALQRHLSSAGMWSPGLFGPSAVTNTAPTTEGRPEGEARGNA